MRQAAGGIRRIAEEPIDLETGPLVRLGFTTGRLNGAARPRGLGRGRGSRRLTADGRTADGAKPNEEERKNALHEHVL